MDKGLRILILEDVPADAELMERELRRAGFGSSSKLVESKEDFLKELKDFAPDIILSDYKLPNFDGMAALEIAKELAPTIPFILVTGSMNEEMAVECMKAGAADYVIKDHLARIGPAVEGALENKRVREEKARLEEALWTAAREWRATFDALNDPLALMDPEGKIRRCNKAMANLIGKGFTEIIGRNCCALIHGTSGPIEGCPVARLRETRRRETSVLSMNDRWFNIVADPLPDENGSVIGAVHIMFDITERKQAEMALQESQRSLEAVVETTPSLVVLTDPDGHIILFNHACEELTGYKREEVLWKTIPELFLPPEWIPLVQKRFADRYAPEVRAPHENPWVTKSGEERLIEWRCTVIASPKDGRPCILGTGIDITERKRAEEALRESEKRYRQVIENATEIIYSLDKEGNFIYGNSTCLKTTGFSLEELRQYKYQDLIVPEHQKKLTEIYIKQFRERQAKTYEEFPFSNKSGKVVWFAQNASLVIEDGEVVGFHIIARDITERKRAEEALRKSEERFRELYDNAPVGYFEYDSHGRITSVNRTELEMLGYSLEEMIGQPVWKFIAEGEVARQQILAKLAGTLLPAIGFERTYRRKDGTVFPVLIEDRLLVDEGGRIKSIRCTIQDITERKRAEEALGASEERYRTLFEEACEGILAADIESGQFKYANPAIGRMLGYTPEELTRLGVADIHPKEALDHVVAEFEAQARGQKTLAPKIPCLRKDGSVIYADIATAPVVIDGRKCNVGFFMDITDRKKVEEALKQTEEQLRQSQKLEAIGRLAGGIAHDFNNLLTVIKGYSQLSLIELKEDVPLRGNIEEIKRASEKAADLTRQLLAFSRRQILEMRVLDLNTVLRDLDKMLRRVIGEDIELITLLADDLGRVKTDPGWVEQTIMNLAVNARDAMPSVGKLTIETANVELDETYARNHIAVTPGRYVMLSMSDTGIGMTPEVRQQVFEPFFTTKEKGKGTGLGLSTVYGIVKQSEGNIWVYSEPGKGATFKIYLPRVDEPLEAIKERVVKEELPRGSETILLVEDEEMVRKLAVQILKRQGYTVLEGSHGNEAFNICNKHDGPIHLLVTDVVMPKMSGLELAERIASIQPEIKVLYMSGYTDNAITHHGVLEKGMNYIQKPFTVDGLARKVREVLDK
jgi:PAS domain S-box-containing protein